MFDLTGLDLPHKIALFIVFIAWISPFLVSRIIPYNIFLRCLFSIIMFFLTFAIYFDNFYLNPDDNLWNELKDRIIKDYNISDKYSDIIKKNLIIKFVKIIPDKTSSWSDSSGIVLKNNFNDESKSSSQKFLDSLNVVFFNKEISQTVCASYITFKYINWTAIYKVPFIKPFINIYIRGNETTFDSFNDKDKEDFVYHEFLHYIFDLKTEENPNFPADVNREYELLDPFTKSTLNSFLDSYRWSPDYSLATEKFAYLWAQIIHWQENSQIFQKNKFVKIYYQDIFKNSIK